MYDIIGQKTPHVGCPPLLLISLYTVLLCNLGINTLINIMSRLGKSQETASEINHYERLEFLGDAVVEFLSR